jgi:RNA ligase (TIGR02306 family)
MSEFAVEVVRIGQIEKHPNADTLSITLIKNGYPVIFRTGDFNEDDLAVYVPIDSIVPNTPEWSFLGDNKRIRAKRLRGIFSMGMLAKLPNDSGGCPPECSCYDIHQGDDVQELMGIKKYEPSLKEGKLYCVNTENLPDLSFMPIYTDIEGLRKWPSVLREQEDVIITEKIHGANARYLFKDGEFYVGSHKKIKKFDERNLWWKAAKLHDLRNKLESIPNILMFGEVFGQVQDLKYGCELEVVFFDAFDTCEMKYLDLKDFINVCDKAGLNKVPVLYSGSWTNDLRHLAEGNTTFNVNHVREGFVVRPFKERFHPAIGRVILKMVGEGYLLRKGS